MSLWVDRPEREQRSVAELVATFGALLAAAAVLIVPGAAGHAAQTSPRGSDARVRLAAPRGAGRCGSVGWPGCSCCGSRCRFARAGAGAVGGRCRASRTSRSARCCVLAGSGIGEAIDHMPAVNALWQTGYGAGDPGQERPAGGGGCWSPRGICCGPARGWSRLGSGRSSARRPPGCCAAWSSGEAGRGRRRSCSPPRCCRAWPPRRRRSRCRTRRSRGSVPARVARSVTHAGYQLQLLVSPNRAAAPTRSRCGSPEAASPCAART